MTDDQSPVRARANRAFYFSTFVVVLLLRNEFIKLQVHKVYKVDTDSHQLLTL